MTMPRRFVPVVLAGVALAVGGGCGSDTAEPIASDLPDPTSSISAPPSSEDSPVTPSADDPLPDTDPTGTSRAPDDERTPAPTNGDTPTSPVTPTEAALVEVAVADLATRLGIEPASIDVVSVDEVTWRDGAVGCPQKDFAYTQATVDGVRIRLAVDETTYQYHAGSGREPFYCADPEPPVGE